MTQASLISSSFILYQNPTTLWTGEFIPEWFGLGNNSKSTLFQPSSISPGYDFHIFPSVKQLSELVLLPVHH